MTARLATDSDSRDALRHWVREREAVRLKKESGFPPPWTDDPILLKYRFCNVRREDDRVTIWIRENIRERFPDDPHLWFMLAIARWINWPDTLAEIIADGDAWPSHGDSFHTDSFIAVLRSRERYERKIFTGAYTINAPSKKGTSKITYVAETVLGEVWNARERVSRVLDGTHTPATLRASHAELSRYQGWGAFMSYQVVVDLRFTRYLRNAEDISTWAAAGPGTIRGLNRIASRRVDYPLEQWRALGEMRALYATIQQETGVQMDFSDVPNILCETDKYLRVLKGEGAPRALYHPTTSDSGESA